MSLGAGQIIGVLIDTSIRISLVAVVISAILAICRVRAGAVRHAAWLAVLVAMLAVPFVPRWIPVLPVAWPFTMQSTQPSGQFPAFRLGGRLVRPVVVRDPLRLTRVPIDAYNSRPISLGFEEVPSQRRYFGLTWLQVAVGLWLAGIAVLTAGLLIGWRRAAKLAASSRAAGDGFYQSELVTTPVGVGLLAPKVILPPDWESWPEDVRRAVLIHEQAHIRRRDALVGLLARVNRCVYWFNPLAWWLERRLRISAEEACDDEVIRALVDPERYAALLLQMANVVRRHGGRVSWHAVGITSGAISHRIDRVLTGKAARRPTLALRASVFAICIAAVVVGVACRTRLAQSQSQAAPERTDPELARQLIREVGGTEFYSTAQHMTPAQVAELERAVSKNPDDLNATRQLLIYYLRTGASVMGFDAMVAARRPYLLAMIERHPESDLAFWPLPRRLDPRGWDQAREIWLKHTSEPHANGRLLSYAARFFAISEKDIAEKLLLRAQDLAVEAQKTMVAGRRDSTTAANAYFMINDLARLYARAIVGADDGTEVGGVRSIDRAESDGLFANLVRSKLAHSTDARLLYWTGDHLTNELAGNPDGTIGEARVTLGFDQKTLGESYQARAVAIDPGVASLARRWPPYRNLPPDGQAGYDALVKQLGDRWCDAEPERVALLPEDDQLGVLPRLASRALSGAEYSASNGRTSDSKIALDRARYLADWAVTLANKLRNNRRHVTTIFEAHMTRGAIALFEGDRASAVKHLSAESLFPESIQGDTVYIMLRLTKGLLRAGERESVATFYSKVSKFMGADEQRLLGTADKIRAGEVPQSVQPALISLKGK